MKKLIDCSTLFFVSGYKEVTKCKVVSVEPAAEPGEYYIYTIGEKCKTFIVNDKMSVGYFGENFIATDLYTAQSALMEAKEKAAEEIRKARIRLSNIRQAEKDINLLILDKMKQ